MHSTRPQQQPLLAAIKYWKFLYSARLLSDFTKPFPWLILWDVRKGEYITLCLFLLLNCSSWVEDILMKSWIEKYYQGVNTKVWKDMRMNNILEKNFFCSWLMVTLVKEVFEQFTVGGTDLRLSKFDTADLVLAIFWSRFWIILFFCSWHDYERTHSCHQSHQGVIRESSDINYTLIMFYEQNCVGRTSVSFSKFHSHCLIYL